MIVDDEPAIRALLDSILSDTYQCTQAESAEVALSHLSSETFDLVVSDINMGTGKMSGIELVSRIVASAPDTVVMVISGNETMDSPIEAMRSGAFDYIRKPFNFDQVQLAVKRAAAHAALLVSKRKHEDHLEQLVEERSAKLNYLAYHDSLTDLVNRPYFEDHLSQTLLTAGQNAAVLFVSLDRFKGLRDTLGHALGDDLLREVGSRLQAAVTQGATVARFEGDEFALLLSDTSEDELRAIADTVFEAFKAPFKIGENEIFVSVSIGISRSPDDGGDAQTLLRNAGAALSHARKQGGRTYQFYTSDINDAAVARLAMENDLRRALDRSEFEMYYQPKIDGHAKMIVGMEALVRWNHPVRGLVPPLDFIPLAEETGLIVPMGEWILRAVCEQCRSWHERGFALDVAVNLSPRQFEQKDLASQILTIVGDTGFDPAFLNLEVTEGSIMNNADAAVAMLSRLQEAGIKISIDDFGTGYSSLGYLKHLPIDVLKIDKSFINDVTTDPDDAALVTAVITLAHNLRLKVVAEGVETEEQLTFLQNLNCDEWQGYLFSKPVPAEAFEALLVKPASV